MDGPAAWPGGDRGREGRLGRGHGIAEAKLRGARVFFYEAVWNSLMRGDPVSLAENGMLRLSASNAARAGTEVVQRRHTAAGMGVIARTNPMQRHLRDAMAVTRHAAVTGMIYEQAGRMLPGPWTEIFRSLSFVEVSRAATGNRVARGRIMSPSPPMCCGTPAMWRSFPVRSSPACRIGAALSPANRPSRRPSMPLFPGAVTLISTGQDEDRRGLIATAVCPVSDAPPSLLACVNRRTATCAAISGTGRLSVPLLVETPDRIAPAFAGGRQGAARLGAGTWSETAQGSRAWPRPDPKRQRPPPHLRRRTQDAILARADALVHARSRFHRLQAGCVDRTQRP